MKHGEIQRFEKEGLRMKDGTLLSADAVVLATGKCSREPQLLGC